MATTTNLSNLGSIIARDLEKKFSDSGEVFAKVILANSRILAPKKTRALADSGRVEKTSNGYRVGYSASYAWYQERGYTTGPVRHYTTPGTQAHYLSDSVNSALKGGFKL